MTQPIIDCLANDIKCATGGGGIQHEAAGHGLVGGGVGEAEEGGGEGEIWRNWSERVEGRGEKAKEESERGFGHAEGFDPSRVVVGCGGGEEALEPAGRRGRGWGTEGRAKR